MSEKKIRIGNEEFKVLGSMQEIMAEVELKRSKFWTETPENFRNWEKDRIASLHSGNHPNASI